MLPRLSFLVLLGCFLSTTVLAKTPLVEQPAHFYYEAKAYKDALLYLFEIDGELSASSQTLEKKLKRELGLISVSVLGDDTDCALAMKALDTKKGFNHMAICLLETGGEPLEKATKIDQSIADIVEQSGRNSDDQWLAYAYYNLAIHALGKGEKNQANVYFDKALGFIQLSEEGRGLYNRIWLERAYAEYYANQYAAAMDAFKKVGLDSAFKSEALLGFGWAAFYSYERGIALEAWRQVALQKHKSMSVYEALLAIPFALEKANAFSRGLSAYEFAISEYDSVLKQIDTLQNELSIQDIQNYIKGNEQAVPEMLPELLGVAFARKNFRVLIDEAIALRQQEFVLKHQLQQLQGIHQIVTMVESDTGVDSDARIAKVKTQLAALTQKIDTLRIQFVDYIGEHDQASDYLHALVSQYQQLQSIATPTNEVVQDKLQGLQILLLINAYYEDVLDKKDLKSLIELVREKRFLENRVDGIKKTKEALELSPSIRKARFKELQQRINSLRQQQNSHALKVQEKLLQMTREQLVNYQKQILEFSKQARVASARLQEEFYQLGGHE